MRRGRWMAFGMTIVVGLTLTTLARAQGGSTGSAAAVPRPRGIDALHGSAPTWGRYRPQYGAMSFAPDGTLYVADGWNMRVYEVDSDGPAGTTTVVAGSGPGGWPTWVHVPRHGWVTPDGYGGDGLHATDALFSGIFDLTFDVDGNLFLTDHLNGRIREIDTDGFVRTVAGVGPGGPHFGPWTNGVGPAAGDGGAASHAILDAPWGLTFGPGGDLFIADRDHEAVRKVDTHGIMTTVAGTGVKGYNGDDQRAVDAKLNRPIDVTFDPDGNLYISDENNRRIRKVDTHGTITTFAGNGDYGCSGNGGPAIDASFKDPGEIVVAPDGSMLVGDNECHAIRRIAPDGTITTFAHDAHQTCRGVLGAPVRHLPVPAVHLAYGPDGHLYIADACHRILRVDDHGRVRLFARAPRLSDL